MKKKTCIVCGAKFGRTRYARGDMEKPGRFAARTTCRIECFNAERARRAKRREGEPLFVVKIGPRRDLFSEKLYREYTRRIAKLPRKKRTRAYVRST